jgi:hypothetical protein
MRVIKTNRPTIERLCIRCGRKFDYLVQGHVYKGKSIPDFYTCACWFRTPSKKEIKVERE